MKQCPAFSVVPVFTPAHPLLNSLLVLFHWTFREMPYLSLLTVTLYDLVLTILEKQSFLQATAANRETCSNDVVFGFQVSPDGFLNTWIFSYWLDTTSLQITFIYLTKVCRGVRLFWIFFFRWMIRPTIQANATAASFPLGSIKPYSNSSILRMSPACSSAEVPTIAEASSDILQRNEDMSTQYFLQARIHNRQVTILVRDAISVGPLLVLWMCIIYRVQRSSTQQSWADIQGRLWGTETQVKGISPRLLQWDRQLLSQNRYPFLYLGGLGTNSSGFVSESLVSMMSVSSFLVDRLDTQDRYMGRRDRAGKGGLKIFLQMTLGDIVSSCS